MAVWIDVIIYVNHRKILWIGEFSLFYFKKYKGLEDKKLVIFGSKLIYICASDI